MKNLVYGIMVSAFLVGSAFAQQQKTFNFQNLSPDEANMILNQLGKMPWADVNPLLQKLIVQIRDQQQPPAAAQEAPKE
jgi:hypothetical protein